MKHIVSVNLGDLTAASSNLSVTNKETGVFFVRPAGMNIIISLEGRC